MVSDHTVYAPGSAGHAGPVQNVGGLERALTGGVGAALLVSGLKRRSIFGLLLAAAGGALAYRGVRGVCPAYSALGIDTHREPGPARPEDFYQRGVLIYTAVTVNAEPEQLYQFWRSLENLPRFMRNLEEVRVIDQTRSCWVAKGPTGKRLEWDAEIINDEPPHTIAWRSLEHADIEHTGSVRFIPASGGRGTHVKVRMEYLPPGGKVTDRFLRLVGQDPRTEIREDLLRFKQIIEAGEIATTEGQPAGPPRLDRRRTPRDRSRPADLTDRAGAPDPVTEASKGSFPASDAPGWTSVTN
ncbi:MAG: SRPBCC family protein [Phycisphaerales bacterium]